MNADASNVITIIQPYLIAIFIFVIALTIVLVVYVRKNNQRMRQQIKEQNHQDISAFKSSIIDMNRKLLDDIVEVMNSKEAPLDEAEAYRKHQEQLVNIFQKLRKIIKDDLSNTMSNTGACRIALYLLHNGQKSTGGVDFLKTSCVGEKVLIGSGIKEHILNHSNIPLNILDNMIENLVDNGKYIVMNDEETMQTARSQFISSSKIRYSYMVSIYDYTNNMLGFVLAEYDHVYTKNESDKEYAALKELADKIAPILSFSEYSKLTLSTLDQ